MEPTATEKRKSLRQMLAEPACHLAPSCNDGIQARLVEWLGFPLVHISGSGQHRSLGFADAGLLTLTEMIDRAREIVDAVNIPIVSDAETGRPRRLRCRSGFESGVRQQDQGRRRHAPR